MKYKCDWGYRVRSNKDYESIVHVYDVEAGKQLGTIALCDSHTNVNDCIAKVESYALAINQVLELINRGKL